MSDPAGECQAMVAACGQKDLSTESLKGCIEQGCPFVDQSFFANDNSGGKTQAQGCAWMRPEVYVPKEQQEATGGVKLFHQLSSQGVGQGALGDCFFCGAMSSLAEFPNKVKRLFVDPDIHEPVKGYLVKLCHSGWWKVFPVDTYFPVQQTNDGTYQPIFCWNRNDPSEIWMQLLEKAFAKCHGGYCNIEGGDACAALTDLTGYPFKKFSFDGSQDTDAIFASICNYDAEGYALTIGTPGTDTSAYMQGAGGSNPADMDAKYKAAGIVTGHEYSILQVKAFPQLNARLVQIRNPWGNATEWTGKWSDNDSAWAENPDVAEQCGHTVAADGTFWMDWSDVLNYFMNCGVCFAKLGHLFNDYRITGTFSDQGIPNVSLEVTCLQPTKMIVILSQKDTRGTNNNYESICLLISSDAGNSQQMVQACASNSPDEPGTAPNNFYTSRNLSIIHTFQPGVSLVIPRINQPNPGFFYNIGLISEGAIGDGSIQVKFKYLQGNCGAFSNQSQFAYDGTQVGYCTTQWQLTGDGAPVESGGSQIGGDINGAPQPSETAEEGNEEE